MENIGRYESAAKPEPVSMGVSAKPQAAAGVEAATEPPSYGTPPAGTQAPAQAPVTAEVLAETLLGYGYKATEENKAMLRLMLENGIALTKENIGQMNRAVKLAGSHEKALFMFKNNIKMTQKNAAQLEGLLNGQTKITAQIESLLAAVGQLGDGDLAAQIKQILSGVKAQAAATTEAGTPQSAEGATAQQTQGGVQASAQVSATQTSAQSTATQPATQAPAAQPPTAQTATTQATQTSAAQPAVVTPQAASSPTQPVATAQVVATAEGTTAEGTTAQPATPANVVAHNQQVQTSTTQTGVTAQAGTTDEGVTVRPATTQNAVQQPAQPSATAQPAQAQYEATQNAKTPSQPADTMYSLAANTQTPAQSTPQGTATPQTTQSPAIPSNLLYHLAESTPQSIDNYLNNLRQALTQIQQALSGRTTPETARVLQEAAALESHIDFAAQIRNQIFVQLPLYHNGQQTQTTLHVYKDAKKSRSGDGNSSSALIALDTAALGHFETYVQKNNAAINCQFRLENDEIVQAVRDNIHKLSDLLRESGYSLENFSFLPPGEPYTLLDNPTESPSAIGDELPFFDKKV